MAKNIIFENADQLTVAVPSGTVSGDLLIIGDVPAIALTDRDADGNATVKFNGVAEVSVKGVNGTGNSAVAANDVLYYTAGDTPPVSKKNTGIRVGLALAAIAGGATATIRVRVGY